MTETELSTVPPLGLGTWQNDDETTCKTSVQKAIELGYRHIDTAQIYKNEEYVGSGIQESEIPREKLFVATKLWNDQTGRDTVRKSTETSLQRLGLDQIDLLYVHWPAGNYDPEETLPELESLKEEGLIRHIGLSNFIPSQIEKALSVLSEAPCALQVEMHPYLQQRELQQICIDNGMYLVAYSPFRHGTIFNDPVLKEIADAHSATAAQVCLSWIMDKEHVVAIPKATGDDHLKENWESLNVTLSGEETERIDDLDRGDRYIDPPFAPDW